jgi:4-amino-4-deoxy-L-arabinose transferase-like glycosyltransferase
MLKAKPTSLGGFQKRLPKRASKKQALPSSTALSPKSSRIILTIATLLCLLPFVGKAFNIDDPLFIWVAQHVVHHPLNPYGFSIVWYFHETPISDVTKNPPLASYYAALVGPWTHWSEIALHLEFLLPALAAMLATYELGRTLTSRPLLAAAIALAAPVFLTSATSVMCDVPMFALWMLAVLTWRKGLTSGQAWYLALSALLIALCALTKYFGACLIPLLFAYSLFRQRRFGLWALYFLIPIGALIWYQLWTRTLYDHGLLLDAAQYAQVVRSETSTSRFVSFLTGFSFTGGCMLPALLMAPLLYRWRWIAGALVLAIPSAIAIAWPGLEPPPDRTWLAIKLVPFIMGGIITLALTVTDLWRRRDADSVLLAGWVVGTFIFAAFLNWTVNARSVLPLIPAAAILICRRMEDFRTGRRITPWKFALPVAACLAVSLLLASADATLANSARDGAQLAYRRAKSEQNRVFFTGHWGFQYYMQALGARPVDNLKGEVTTDDVLVQPENNTDLYSFSPDIVDSAEPIEIQVSPWVIPQRREMGAGFFASVFGPLPFAFGDVPPERYWVVHFKSGLTAP